MDKKYYTNERNIQIIISLLKNFGINKVIASPGATNVTFVGSLQNDPFFEMYSCIDERSAAYMACGMAAELGEPVVLSCTGATSSRNYMPALTEAYYRKLPILVVTSTQDTRRVGHMIAQVTDRSVKPNDTYVHAEYIPTCIDATSVWDATIRLNRAILALSHRGGGPVHINLATNYSGDFSVKELPVARCIRRYMMEDELPSLPFGRIGILVGNHLPWPESLTDVVNRFCEAYGAVVFCEHASNYTGPFRVYNAIVNQQSLYKKDTFRTDVLIHIGEVSGYGNGAVGNQAGEVWRVNEDGELRDPYHKLTKVFEMKEGQFFLSYVKVAGERKEQQKAGDFWLKQCHTEYQKLHDAIPDLPFSNLWIAGQTAHRLPEGCVLHIGILNSLRAWDIFEVPKSVRGNGFVNTGGFGIDGCMSSMIGGAIAQTNKLHFLVIGDLAFFYDMNVLGNRHVGNNIRILLINNGKGTEFRNYNHPAAQFGEDADKYMAAAGHFGNKSHLLVRHYAEDLGYEYLQASNKEEYLAHLDRFIFPEITDKPILFEVFTNNEEESNALKLVNTLMEDTSMKVKQTIKAIIPNSVKDTLKRIIK